MAPKRRSSEADQQVIKRGCLLKSPPSYLFTNRNSWKRRLFKLYKSLTDFSYIISYYEYDGMTENLKKEINVSSIKAVELGTNTTDKNVATILKLFGTSAENILCIKTECRNYYLLDDSADTIADWQRSITDVWVQSNRASPVSGPRITHNVPLHQPRAYQAEGARPKSCPDDRSGTRPSSAEQIRERSVTDPGTCKGNQANIEAFNNLHLQNVTQQKNTASQESDRKRSLTHSDCLSDRTPIGIAIRRVSDAYSDQGYSASYRISGNTTDGTDDSDSKHIYDTPRPVRTQSKRESESSADQEETSGFDSSGDENVYEPMVPVFAKETIDCPPTPTWETSKLTDPHSEQGNQSDLEKINITIPTEHFRKYLALDEAGERLFVCKWKGPMEIGCMFHYGDHIDTFNDIRPEGKQMFDNMLNNCISEKVNLVVFRNMKADIFHVDGCNCNIDSAL